MSNNDDLNDDLVRSLEKLGMSPDSILPRDERLYRAMVEVCQATGKPCSASQAARHAGMTPNGISSVIKKLIDDGRAFRLGMYDYVPNTEE